MISLVSPNIGLSRSIADSRDLLSDLQNQLATQKKVSSYGDLGSDRSQILSFRSELSQLDSYQRSISHADVRIDVLVQSLERLREIGTEAKTDALATGFELHAGGQTIYQSQVAAKFDETVSLLNQQINGSYLFAGRDTEAQPVRPASEILDGAGAQAGFKQIVSERRDADLGADGRGRLTLPAVAVATSSISEDVAGHPFGFKLSSVGSTLTGTTVAGPAGAPATVDVTFTATLPNDGETLSLTLDLPDGTQTSVTLTATTGVAGTGEFTIGVDEATTAANFRTALDQVVQDEASRSLSAASAIEAADNFFDFDSTTPPQRVDGPPFSSATALIDATTADTVFWYEGEVSTSSARESQIVRADDAITAAVGARANEQALTTTIKQLAAITVETFSATDTAAKDRYNELTQRASSALSFPSGTQSVDQIVTELSISKTTISKASERHDASNVLLEGLVADAEVADIYEVSTQILALQGRIEASLRVTASLSQLSLTNFL